MKIYGIKNCNTMKKAFDYLNDKGVAYEFFDYKKSVICQDELAKFIQLFGQDKVINKQGTTYRKFDDETKAVLAGDDLTAIYQIVKDNQSVLKRPIITGTHQGKDVALIGFDASLYDDAL